MRQIQGEVRVNLEYTLRNAVPVVLANRVRILSQWRRNATRLHLSFELQKLRGNLVEFGIALMTKHRIHASALALCTDMCCAHQMAGLQSPHHVPTMSGGVDHRWTSFE